MQLKANEAKRVALYARVSTGHQEADNQLNKLRQYAKRAKWTIYKEYIDHESGSKNHRQELNNLFADASQRNFDIVLFWSLDRFTREGVLPTLRYLNQLDGYGVEFKSLTEQYLDSTGIFKDAVISILATVAKQERVRISDRVKAGLETARKKGKILGRPRKPKQLRQKVVEFHKKGIAKRAIARQIGVAESSVRNWLKPTA